MTGNKKSLMVEELENRVAPILVVAPIPEPAPSPDPQQAPASDDPADPITNGHHHKRRNGLPPRCGTRV